MLKHHLSLLPEIYNHIAGGSLLHNSEYKFKKFFFKTKGNNIHKTKF